MSSRLYIHLKGSFSLTGGTLLKINDLNVNYLKSPKSSTGAQNTCGPRV